MNKNIVYSEFENMFQLGKSYSKFFLLNVSESVT